MSENVELHRRTIGIRARQTGPDRLEVRASLRDDRHFGMTTVFGVHPPGVVHDMGLELSLDRDLVIRSVAPWMDTIPFEPSERTRGEGCRHILPNYERLVGLKVDPDYAMRLPQAVGGPQGCFHLLSLAQCLPPALGAAVAELGFRDFRRRIVVRAYTDETRRLGMSAEVVDEGAADGGAEIRTWLALPRFEILEATFAEGGAAPARLDELEGVLIAKGFTTIALDKLAGRAGFARLAALLIAFVPVTAQAAGALAGYFGTPRKWTRRGATPQADSCHMWRTGGPVMGALDENV